MNEEMVTDIHGKGGGSSVVECQALSVRADPIQVGHSHTAGGSVEGEENVMVWVRLWQKELHGTYGGNFSPSE